MLIAFILSIIFGYLLGSINPAYILGRLRGIDIRQYGSKNTGAMNSFHVLGKTAGITTLMFDMIKGALALLIAYFIIRPGPMAFVSGLPFMLICFAGFAAVLGHDFPFYLKFKGGKGGAATGGIIIALLVLMWIQESISGVSWLTWIPFILIVFLGLSLTAITKSGNLAGFIFYPIGVIWILLFKLNRFSVAISLFLFYLIIISIINIKQKGGLLKDIEFAKRKDVPKIKVWRKVIRIFGLLLPIIYFFSNKLLMLIIFGVLTILFFYVDLIRWKKQKNKKKIKVGIYKALYKKNESTISNLSLFIVGAFATVLLFPKTITILALSFLIVGDTAAEILGIKFGRVKLIGKKTLEGSLACFASSIIILMMWLPFLNISIFTGIAGALAVTIAELFSGRYDNLTIDLLAGLAMILNF